MKLVLLSTTTHLCLIGPAAAQLRIVSYNSLGDPRASTPTVLQAIGDEVTGGIAKPIDVLLLQEQNSVTGDTQDFVDELNALYGAGVYARGTLNGTTSGAGRPTIVYNTQTVQLLEEIAFGDVNTSANARQTLRYKLRPVGYTSAADFYAYNDHYKASQGTTNQNRRNVEAMDIRENSDALPQGTHIIYAGDFNIYTSGEPMWGTLTAAGNGQAFDPINRVGSWHDNNNYVDVHTQSPVTSGGPGATGGMDDRFDHQMTTAEFLDGEGLSYITGSYHALGNNGTHSNFHSQNLAVAQNTALDLTILQAIASASDHLPVVADYQVPAIMTASIASAPPRVLVGSSVDLQVDVENTANVVHTNGADELDYTVDITGSIVDNISDIDTALGGGNSHLFAYDTAAASIHAALVGVTSTSQAVANGTFFDLAYYDVVDHANGSFDGGSNVDSLTVDFGIVTPGSGVLSQALALHNLEVAVGYTAMLDLDSIGSSGDDGILTTSLTTFSDLAAGASNAFDVFLDSAATGAYSATYMLALSDEDLPGETTGLSMTLNLEGIVALTGDATLDGAVDIGDFTVWGDKFGTGSTFQEGDFSGDGTIDIGDFTIWGDNFGMTANAPGAFADGSVSVPEPSTFLLLFIGSGATMALAERRRRSSHMAAG